MNVVERFNAKVLFASLSLMGIGCAAGLFFSVPFSVGLLIGSVVSCVLFYINVFMSQRLPDNNWMLGVYMVLLPLVRLGAYVSVLWLSYHLDKGRWTGFAGAAAGLGLVYVMSAVFGYTGWDLQKETK